MPAFRSSAPPQQINNEASLSVKSLLVFTYGNLIEEGIEIYEEQQIFLLTGNWEIYVHVQRPQIDPTKLNIPIQKLTRMINSLDPCRDFFTITSIEKTNLET